MVTTFVFLIVTFRCVILEIIDGKYNWRRFGYSSFQNFGYYTINQIREVNGLAICAVWLVLLVQGRWRSVPDRIDRLGGLLGAFWIISSLLKFPTL